MPQKPEFQVFLCMPQKKKQQVALLQSIYRFPLTINL